MLLGEFSRVWKRMEPRLSRQTGVVTVPVLLLLFIFRFWRPSALASVFFFLFIFATYTFTSHPTEATISGRASERFAHVLKATYVPVPLRPVDTGRYDGFGRSGIFKSAQLRRGRKVSRFLSFFGQLQYGTIHTTHGDNRGVMTGQGSDGRHRDVSSPCKEAISFPSISSFSYTTPSTLLFRPFLCK